MLHLYCHNSCADPRDGVFPLIGAVKDGEKEVLKDYLPDYELSYDEVIVISLAHIQRFGGEPSVNHPLLEAKTNGAAKKLLRVATLFNECQS